MHYSLICSVQSIRGGRLDVEALRDGTRWLVEAEGHVWLWYVRLSFPRVMNRDAPQSLIGRGAREVAADSCL